MLVVLGNSVEYDCPPIQSQRTPRAGKILTLLQRVRQNHFARRMRIPRPRLALSWAKPDCRADGQPVVRDPLDKPSVFKCRRRLVAPSESARAHGHPPQAAGRPSWTQPPVAFTVRRLRWNYPSARAFGSSALAGVQKPMRPNSQATGANRGQRCDVFARADVSRVL